MKILFNVTNTLSYGGLQVALSILRQWSGNPGHSIVLAAAAGHEILQRSSGFEAENIRIETVPHRMAAVKTRRVMRRLMDDLVKKYQADIVFTPFGPSYWTPKVPHLLGFALGQIVYPDSPVNRIMPLKKRLKYFLEFQCYKKYHFKRNSRFFWCETEDVKQRMVRYLHLKPEQIIVAGNCCSQLFYEFDGGRKAEGTFNILCPCSGNLHKNLEIIPEMQKFLKNLSVKFMVTLPEAECRRIFGKDNPDIVNLGVLPPEKCPEAYAQSDVVFVPSLLECFTANYPEAMAMKKPIVTADLSFARNLCGDAALYFTPLSAENAAEKIIDLCHNADLRNDLIAAGSREIKKFPSPEQRAGEILRFMQYIISNS